MSVSVTFFSLISQLLEQTNYGLQEALEAASGEEQLFIAPQVEVTLKCVVLNDGQLKVVPSNGAVTNQYGALGDSTVRLTFKLIPKEKNENV